jgi:adenine-specific DNA-methyltransferase
MISKSPATRSQKPAKWREELVLDPRLSYGSRSDNAIIQGDNQTVLRILAPKAASSVRCIYIDPPYNNQESYVHYRDALSHEKWLAQVRSRLMLLWPLLRQDGSLWISIDDREGHYLKVMLDRLFGRSAFVASIVWEQRTTRENRRAFSFNHEYILVYAKDPRLFRKERHRLPLNEAVLGRYRNPDKDPRGEWQSISLNVQAGHGTRAQFYDLVTPTGRHYRPPKGRCWIYTKTRMQEEIRQNNVWFGHNGDHVPRLKRFLTTAGTGLNPETLWRAAEVGTTDSAKKHLIGLFPKRRQFDTPKPEALIARILSIASDPGDLVLDAYLGSGTTAAVAHKMRRRYIGIEREKNAIAFAVARLRRVVHGEAGGISPSVNWAGGGGFEGFRLSSR